MTITASDAHDDGVHFDDIGQPERGLQGGDLAMQELKGKQVIIHDGDLKRREYANRACSF
ncbi:hypothetical protein [Paenibacillus sp. V4I9]|uniref:hypothetical protein n=1 Tax=Paenibacillus sp. V4I9 TaxID=3042308 RepID=UPI0027D7C397|nr:hypothetical protein [Paenibacillus sp. V4I9]